MLTTPLLLVLASPIPAADAPYAIGHVSAAWPGPAGDATAEIYYPAAAAGEGVPVAAGEHPLLVFGHGYLMPADAYGYLPEALVPDGFVVALLTTAGELFPDHGAFAQDFRTVAEGLLADGEDPAALFFEALSGRVAALGHSMGGGASVLAAAGSDAFTAVANLAAAETNPSAVAAASSLTQPLLLLSGGDDCVTPPSQQAAIYAAAGSSCKAWLTLAGGTHCQFASAASACELGELFCSSSLSGQAQRALVLALLTPWLRAVLELDASAWAGFEAASETTAGVSTSSVCASDATIGSVGELDAALAGTLEIAGSGLDFTVGAAVGGAPAAVQDVAPNQLALELAAGAPGIFELELEGLFGSLVLPGAVVRYPALGAGPALLGQTLELELRTGIPAPYLLGWSFASIPPLELPGVWHALELGPPLVVLASGASDANGVAELAPVLPNQAVLLGVTVRLQGYAIVASGPSFTNRVELTLES